ncbi:MAG: hypothetical protein U0Q55_08475 [Vicinamibacterales bacterium]
MRGRLLAFTLCGAALATVVAMPAQAQTTATSGLQITPIESGFIVAPDVRFTTVNDRSTTLAGVYGGYEFDRTLFVGAAGYWNTNRDRDHELQYGGGVVKWTLFGHNPVSVSVGSLVGAGTATLTRTYGDLFGTPVAIPANLRMGPNGQVITITSSSRISASTPVRLRDDFVVAEPQVTVILKLASWARLDVGGGFRFVGSSRYLDNQLKGASGSVAIRLGSR